MSHKIERLLDTAAAEKPGSVHHTKQYRDRATEALLVHHSEESLLGLPDISLRALNNAVAHAASEGWAGDDLADYVAHIPLTFWAMDGGYQDWVQQKLAAQNLPSNVVSVTFGAKRQP